MPKSLSEDEERDLANAIPPEILLMPEVRAAMEAVQKAGTRRYELWSAYTQSEEAYTRAINELRFTVGNAGLRFKSESYWVSSVIRTGGMTVSEYMAAHPKTSREAKSNALSQKQATENDSSNAECTSSQPERIPG